MRNQHRNDSFTVIRIGRRIAGSLLAAGALALAAGCSHEQPPAAAPRVADVTATTIEARDVPIDFEFVAQTRSTREVEIRARVEGFIEKRLYGEGTLVRAGQTMFQMDRKPFEAALQSARGQLAQQQARLDVAKATLARIRPLAAQNAVSQKDLDDAVGAEQAAQAAVVSAQGQVETAKINLGYTTIASPLSGLSSYARKQDGSYVTPGPDGLLTTVAALHPIEVNFSVSENEFLRWQDEVRKGTLKFPANRAFDIEVVLADGSVYPNRGHITFIDPSFNPQTGTFLVRAEIANQHNVLRPGQFVRAIAKGVMRPNAIVVPQRAILQGAKSHYVWVVDKSGKAEQRMVEAGQWKGDDWIVNNGLRPGERIVVDGAIRVTAGAPLKIGEAAPTEPAAIPPAAPAPAKGEPAARPKAPSQAAHETRDKLELRMSILPTDEIRSAAR